MATVKYGMQCASLEEPYKQGLPRLSSALAPYGSASPSTTIRYVNNTDRYITVKERSGFERTLRPSRHAPSGCPRPDNFPGIIIWVEQTHVPRKDVSAFAHQMDVGYKGLGRSLATVLKGETIFKTEQDTYNITTPYYIPLTAIEESNGLYYRTLDLYLEVFGEGDKRPHPFLVTSEIKTELDCVDYRAAKAPYVQRIRYIDNTKGADTRTRYINIMGHVFPVEVEQDDERKSGVYITHKSNVCAEYEDIDETHFYALDSELVLTYFYKDSTSAAKEGSLEYRRAKEEEERKQNLEIEMGNKRLGLEELKIAYQNAKKAELETQHLLTLEREKAKAEHENKMKLMEEEARKAQLEEAELKRKYEEATRVQAEEAARLKNEHEIKIRKMVQESEEFKAKRLAEDLENQKLIDEFKRSMEKEKLVAEQIRRELQAESDKAKMLHEREVMEMQKERARIEAAAKDAQSKHEAQQRELQREADETASRLRTQRDIITAIGAIATAAVGIYALVKGK